MPYIGCLLPSPAQAGAVVVALARQEIATLDQLQRDAVVYCDRVKK
jgi:hypothetical protein